jgi:hypothetical protein
MFHVAHFDSPEQRRLMPSLQSDNIRTKETAMERIINGTAHITAAAAADELKTTMTRILMLLRDKALAGEQVDGEWYVAVDSLACAKAHGTDQKVAKGCASYCSSGGCGCK